MTHVGQHGPEKRDLGRIDRPADGAVPERGMTVDSSPGVDHTRRMSKRVQILVPEGDYQLARRVARQRGLTFAEWVRQAIRVAARAEPVGDPDKKIAAVRLAVLNDFPAPDIEVMLDEIEQGYARGQRE